MTHCLGCRAAAAARADEITALGIDAEPHQPFPLTHRRLDFRMASVSFQPAERTFSAEFLVPGPRIGEDEVSRFHGRWLVDQGIVLTAIALLPARGEPAPSRSVGSRRKRVADLDPGLRPALPALVEPPRRDYVPSTPCFSNAVRRARTA
ncbi:hypothetical protein B1K54_27270 [Streptomyces sp. fd1-xmd]|nr:hypothetical protein B1K54_27270 [Streptomyces sp. fd1-xmd]